MSKPLHPNKFDLTNREIESLQLLAAGFRTQFIASEMGISETTVDFHIRNARRKLGAGTREEALAIWLAYIESPDEKQIGDKKNNASKPETVQLNESEKEKVLSELNTAMDELELFLHQSKIDQHVYASARTRLLAIKLIIDSDPEPQRSVIAHLLEGIKKHVSWIYPILRDLINLIF